MGNNVSTQKNLEEDEQNRSQNRNDDLAPTDMYHDNVKKSTLQNKNRHSSSKRSRHCELQRLEDSCQLRGLTAYKGYIRLEQNSSAFSNKRNMLDDKIQRMDVTLKELAEKIIPFEKNTEVSRNCPICFEKLYKNPKLLPCSHTFCLPCLKDHVRNKHSAEILVCPICRGNIQIPKGGLKEFQDNYFVETEEMSKCDICREYQGDRICSECDKNICLFCQKLHKCGFKRQFKCLSLDSRIESGDSDSSSEQSDASIPLFFNRPDTSWTKILLNEKIKFALEVDTRCVSIAPISGTETWTLNGNSDNTYLTLYDTLGNHREKITLPSLAFGLAVEQPDKLFVTFTEETVIRRFIRHDVTTIVPPSVFHPIGIASLPDESLVAVGFDKSNVDEIVLGRVKFYTRSGEEVSTFTTGYDTVPFKICVLESELIALTFPESRFVDIRLKDGNVVGTYRGNSNGGIFDRFIPYDICTGYYCGKPVVFVSDCESDTIHVLSYAAEFIGLALKSRNRDSSDLGEPGSLCCDKDGRLWVSQRDNNSVSVLEISKYVNVIE